VKLITLYDNVSLEPHSLKKDWGFSLFIEEPECSILFDTGSNGSILLHNMKALSLRAPDRIFISHLHSDHIGGLSAVLKNGDIVYYPDSFYNLDKTIQRAGATSVKVRDVTEICPNIYSTGVLSFHSVISEQALVLKEPYGLILIVGCSHPGIQNIADFVVDRFGKTIFLLIGGFHLLGKNRWIVRGIVKGLFKKVHYIAPSHCTGEPAKRIFENLFKERFIKNGVGRTIEIEDGRLSIKL